MQLVLSIPTVEIEVDFGYGSAQGVAVECCRGMTLFEALTSARNKPHGIEFEWYEHHLGFFVTSIDGQANDPTGNWMYSVNGQRANIGCSKFVLKPGDIVRWEFVPFDPTSR